MKKVLFGFVLTVLSFSVLALGEVQTSCERSSSAARFAQDATVEAPAATRPAQEQSGGQQR